jgi:hypothetical protein
VIMLPVITDLIKTVIQPDLVLLRMMFEYYL